MIPVYFPYTYLSPSDAHALRALFPSMAVYQPAANRLPGEMRPLAKEGFLEVIAPPPGGEEDFDRLTRDFHRWANLHQGGAGLRAATLHGEPYLRANSGDGSPAEIVSEIRRRLALEPAPKDREAALTARVFLQLAQEADQLGHQIGRQLARYEKDQARLFDALNGQAGRARSESGSWERADREDNGEDRLDLRMAAWAQLFSSHPFPSPVFVTPRQAVVRHLVERVPGHLRISFAGLSHALQRLDSEKQPLRGDILSQLDALAAASISGPDLPGNEEGEESEGGHAQGPWVHLWPQIHPRRFFGGMLGKGPTAGSLPPQQLPWRNTLVVHIHPPLRLN